MYMKTKTRKTGSPFVQNVLGLFRAAEDGVLSHAALHLYTVLLARMNRQEWSGSLAMSDRSMGASLGMSVRTVAQSRQELEAEGLVTFSMEGTGKNTRCVYRLATDAMQNGIARAVGSSFKPVKDLKQDKDEDGERRPDEARIPLERLKEEMMGDERWVCRFCQNTGMSRDALEERVDRYVQWLQNQNLADKERGDAFAHFASICQKSERRQEEQLLAERRRRAEAQERSRRAAEEERRYREEAEAKAAAERRAAWYRTVEQARTRAAEGDPRAAEWLKKNENLRPE